MPLCPSVWICQVNGNLTLKLLRIILDIRINSRSVSDCLHYLENGNLSVADVYHRMKCHCCKKKTHLEFKCQCEKVFCTHCRLPEIHACPHYVVTPIVLIKVTASKVEKI